MRDTTPAAERIQLDAIRSMAPAERIRLAFDLSESVRRVALAGLRARHPDRTDLELVEMLLGRRLVPAGWPAPRR
jgi:hypothetical protein